MRPVFVAMDCETSGLEPESCEIIEIAGVKFTIDKDGKPEVIDQYETLVAAEGSIPARASEVNHIYDHMLVGAPEPKQAIGGFFRWAGQSAILIAHNAAFDVSFLGSAVYKHNLVLPKNPTFCSRRLSCKIVPEIRHRLADLESYLIGGDSDWLKHKNDHEQHRALYDSMMLTHVFAALLRRADSAMLSDARLICKWLTQNSGGQKRFDKPLNSHELSQQYLAMEKA